MRPWERAGSSLLSWGPGVVSTYYLEGNRDPLMNFKQWSDTNRLVVYVTWPRAGQGVESWRKESGDNCDYPVEGWLEAGSGREMEGRKVILRSQRHTGPWFYLRIIRHADFYIKVTLRGISHAWTTGV